MRILVINQNDKEAKIEADLLEKEGHEVTIENVIPAIVLLREKRVKFDLIIADTLEIESETTLHKPLYGGWEELEITSYDFSKKIIEMAEKVGLNIIFTSLSRCAASFRHENKSLSKIGSNLCHLGFKDLYDPEDSRINHRGILRGRRVRIEFIRACYAPGGHGRAKNLNSVLKSFFS